MQKETHHENRLAGYQARLVEPSIRTQQKNKNPTLECVTPWTSSSFCFVLTLPLQNDCQPDEDRRGVARPVPCIPFRRLVHEKTSRDGRQKQRRDLAITGNRTTMCDPAVPAAA